MQEVSLSLRWRRGTGSVWGGVNILHMTLYGAVFWNYDEKIADNTQMLWLSHNCTRTVSRLSLFLTLIPPASKLWVAKRLEQTQPDS